MYPSRLYRALLCYALVASLAATASAQDKAVVAVLPLRPVNVPAYVTDVLDNTLAVAVGAGGDFRVLSPSDINALLGVERMKDALGCDDVSCAVDIGGALDAELILTGSVGRLGDKLAINLVLVNARTTTVDGRAQTTIRADENAYQQGMRDAAQEVLLQLRDATATAARGRLVVDTEPAGAQVVVDGKPEGPSPVETLLAPGQHRVSAHTGQYFAPLQSVQIQRQQPTSLRLVLEAAPMNPYRKWGHVAFWTGLGVGGLLATIGHVGANRTAADYRGGDVDAHDTNHLLSNMAVAGWAIAAVGMATGLVLWLLSPGDGVWASENLMNPSEPYRQTAGGQLP